MDIEMIFTLLGGLALFIFGMHQMGEGLQKTAGEKMRSILAMLTGTPLRGIIVGALVTVIIQSSSATTVMVVGFVSAGLMGLPQAIGVIMGANIGTTMTAWLVAAKIEEFAWLFVAVGFIMMFFIKNPKFRYIGQIIFAFGVLFIGLNTMSSAMKPLAASPEFGALILRIKDVPILGLLVGAVTTMVVQSSSAAVGVLQTLSSNATDTVGTPLISLYQAVPIMLGSNIGTTITAILATIGASRNAKRAAAAHSVFNIVGSLLFLLLLQPFVWLVNKIVGLLGQTLIPDIVAGVSGLLTPMADNMRESIAIAHTSFNIVNTLIWLPLVWLMVKIVRLIVSGEDPVSRKRLLFLDYKVVGNPTVAIDLATNELARMTEIAMVSTQDSHAIIRGYSKELETKINENEENLDYLENEIVKYLSKIFTSEAMTAANSSRIAGLMHVTNDIERIGDHCRNISDAAVQMQEGQLQFSEGALLELDEAFEMVEQTVKDSIYALKNSDLVLAGKIMCEEDEFDKLEARLRKSHMTRLDQGSCDPQATFIFLELVHTMERISDHCRNIADVVISGKEYLVHAGTDRLIKQIDKPD